MTMDTKEKPAEQEQETRKHTGFGETASPGDRKLPENSKEALDKRLDEASEESFPSSDPISVQITR
ncbi:hypothetical protein [Enterovirga sp.]|uniref:hypothetical protein n=1 Tax=Enterovirga sp. TaxID=2026350 RepID=UPI002C50217F|nr:hypothetical protein [Enterovirga sp.]HMO28882.1 hypothetical protein [Enterovirga sp.]